MLASTRNGVRKLVNIIEARKAAMRPERLCVLHTGLNFISAFDVGENGFCPACQTTGSGVKTLNVKRTGPLNATGQKSQ